MFDIFGSVLESSITASSFFACTVTSLLTGLILALGHTIKNQYSKSFVITVAMLPLIVQVVIMLVNGNLGTGLAVAGAFSLVRFRSVPGSAKEILSIFMAMAVGLATGVGYIGIAIILTLILFAMNIIYSFTRFGEKSACFREVKITIPESLNYTEVFEDIFKEYTCSYSLKRVKTTNMGSLFQLTYNIVLKDQNKEKEFIDKIRCRNGNLEISSSYYTTIAQEL